ncbi:VWA domain-containing protein [Nocardioides humilatus]|uniref:VWA domain-containing protein n=1 Tax=Nocardioides humilatus TaxID=2607660 RepID=A0A5B1LEJ7_9ACTN|nr:vWA domain-containing protein [Nocardioides humilatus]KAA1419075.1 VWA domain-containing protein [Nocardioides humilatus]
MGRAEHPMSGIALVVARRVGILIALLVVLWQPGFGTRAAPTGVTDIDVLVVVDRTRSMAALDYDGRPRIDGVKRDLVDLADALPGSRFALMTFGGVATLELPFTSDTSTFATAVDTLRLEGPFDGTGSSTDRPMTAMQSVLQRADEQHPDRRRIVVFVSDGENTDGAEPASYDGLEDLVDGGIVLGYGTEDGAKMPAAADLSGDEGFVYDQETGEDAISHFDGGELEAIAEQLGVSYAHRTQPGGMTGIADGFDAAADLDEGPGAPAKHDLTWVFGLVLLALVLVELRSWWRALWTSHAALQPVRQEGTP